MPVYGVHYFHTSWYSSFGTVMAKKTTPFSEALKNHNISGLHSYCIHIKTYPYNTSHTHICIYPHLSPLCFVVSFLIEIFRSLFDDCPTATGHAVVEKRGDFLLSLGWAVASTWLGSHLSSVQKPCWLMITLWLCQNSYSKWPFIVSFPMKNGVDWWLPSGYVKIAIENGHRNSEFSHE